MDKTLVTFDLPYLTTLNHCNISTINIWTIDYEKTNFTIILECMADDTKLLTICIFKLKNILRESFSQGIHICVNKKG